MEFLNEIHKERFLIMEKESGKTTQNKEYELLYFIVAGRDSLWEKRFEIFEEGYKELVLDLSFNNNRTVVGDFTNNETKILNFAMNMFNIRLGKMALAEIMYDLDLDEQKLVFNLIKYKYNM
ncbi:MAG: hypothetical protein ACRDAU_06815 [Clostridium sp.]